MNHYGAKCVMPEEKRATVIIPSGMEALAVTNGRSLSQEAKKAMVEYIAKYAGNSSDRRRARRKEAK